LWTPLHPASYTEASTAEFPTFSVEQLLSSGNLLLSSSGQEFSRLASLGTPADLERARKEAKARLGLDFLDGDDDEDNGWTQELMQEATDVQITEDDPAPVAKSPDSNKMDMTSPGSRVEDMASPMSVEEPFPPPPRPVVPGRTESRQQFSDDRAGSPISGIVEDMSALSARERNRLKRKRKKEESSGHFVAHVPVPHTK
jgi:TATA-binding protein-associated factor